MDSTPIDLTPQDALVALMVAISASDGDMRTSELVTIDRIVHHLPIFADYDDARVRAVSSHVLTLFEDENGLDRLFREVRAALPDRLSETAYAMVCDVAAADGSLEEDEMRLLEEIRWQLELDRLHAAAIERAARARHCIL